MKSIVTQRVYTSEDDEADDPVQVVASVGYEAAEPMDLNDGVHIIAHGGGKVWLCWDDVPVIVKMLEKALKDRAGHSAADG